MSVLRREVRNAAAGTPVLRSGTAYYAIFGAVQAQDGLCHGRLHDGRGAHCAIGSFWTTSDAGLPSALVDEVAAVNDSVPHLSNKQRKAHVLRWLRWKLDQVGIRGIRGTRAERGAKR